MEVEYAIRGPVTNEELNTLFRDARAEQHQESDFRPLLRRSLGYVCARRGGQLAGFVNIAWDGGSHAFLLDPTVRTDCRRAGIGRELVRRAEQLAREAGAEWLHVDFEPHLEAFYQRCGFRKTRAGIINLKDPARGGTR